MHLSTSYSSRTTRKIGPRPCRLVRKRLWGVISLPFKHPLLRLSSTCKARWYGANSSKVDTDQTWKRAGPNGSYGEDIARKYYRVTTTERYHIKDYLSIFGYHTERERMIETIYVRRTYVFIWLNDFIIKGYAWVWSILFSHTNCLPGSALADPCFRP